MDAQENITKVARISTYYREKIVKLTSNGKSQREVHRLILREDKTHISTTSICKFLSRYNRTGSMTDTRRKRPELRIIKDEHLNFIEQQMQQDPENTASDLVSGLSRTFRLNPSLSTVKRARRSLGWTFSSTKYCQTVRDANKPKRLDFANMCIRNAENFDNCIFTDETTIKINTSARYILFLVVYFIKPNI